MTLAAMVAQRSTCPRRQVGALLVRDRRILATGYNGSPPGLPHCTEEGCLLLDGHCQRTIHAEQNALVQCALHGVSSQGATLYCTASPCADCTRLLLGAGVQRVVYRDAYPDGLADLFWSQAGLRPEAWRPAQ